MKLSKKILPLISFLFSVVFSTGQQTEDTYQAVHWDIDDGLSQGVVTSMLKDMNGFLWIGTEAGLNRFDGGNFKIYFSDKNKKDRTIVGNNINSLIEDSLHNIWIGTDKGLSCYNINADTFKNFPSGVAGQSMVAFWATRNEVFFWDYPESQLAAYNIRSFKKRTLVKLDLSSDLVGANVTDKDVIFDASSNSVWMVKGIPGWVGGTGGGLLQISLTDGKRQNFVWPCYRKISNHSHFSQGIKYDRIRNSIWLNSLDGLIEFSLNDKKFHHTDALDKWLNLKDYIDWAGIDIDIWGRVWIATSPGGIFIYDPVNDSARVAFPNDSVLQQTVSDANLAIYCGEHGMVWSGFWTRKGLYQILPFSQAVTRYTADSGNQNSLSDNEVYNCMNGEDGNVWIGTSNGLNIFDPRTGSFHVLYQKDLPGLVKKRILPISIDTVLQKAWVSDHEIPTLYEMDIHSKKCRPVIFKDSANNTITNINFIFSKKYKRGCVIVGFCEDKQRIFIVNGENTVAREILSFPNETINELNTTDEDELLFLRRSKGAGNLTCAHRNGKWIPIHNVFDTIQWSSITFSKADKTYWAIAERELLHYDKDFNLIRRYTREDGIPEIEIINVIADNNGYAWFNTDRAIFLLNTKTGIITKLSEKDGFQKQNFVGLPTPLIKDVNGDLYFPCGRVWGVGFDRVHPEKFKNIYPPSVVYLQSLEINQNTFTSTSGVNNLQDLKLKYYQNNIAIETGVIDYYSKGKSRIRYKLDEINKTWQYAPAYYTIRYDGLQPGKYKLLIQAANAVDQFNGPVKTLLIQITPAFWNTWWFRTLIALFVFAAFYVIVRYRAHKKFKLQLERSQKEKQLAELQQQKTELEMQALRAQMNPHFIFNSLNSINRFILQSNKAQASEYLTKFSRLVRMILQNSQASLIILENELESLELYLNLEVLRFDYHFDYNISVDDDLDVSVLKIPPLIIQPYVENAIWHGLMHKEEKGRLDIKVSQNNNYLYLKIIDNGVGREKAAELTSKSITKHKSMGLQITAHRIAMMKNSNGKESPVVINDLVEPDGSAAGTEVIIKLPVIYD